MTDPSALHGLHAITDGPRPDLLDAVARVLAGGARVVQYRDATDDHARRAAETAGLAALCREHGALLIINGDVELAASTGADGVHLGEWGEDIAGARRRLGGRAIIGLSCKGSLERAREAARAGVDYISFGAFHPSPTLPDAALASPDLLGRSATLGLPRVAIGGVTPDNARQLIEAGADAVAAISALFGAPDIHAAARRFSALFNRPESA